MATATTTVMATLPSSSPSKWNAGTIGATVTAAATASTGITATTAARAAGDQSQAALPQALTGPAPTPWARITSTKGASMPSTCWGNHSANAGIKR